MIEKNDTIFCDIDGTLFVYRKFDSMQNQLAKLIQSTASYIRGTYDRGSHIVFTTARPESLRDFTIKELKDNDIPFDQLVMGIGRGKRILINDNEPDGKDRAIAYSLKRNEGI